MADDLFTQAPDEVTRYFDAKGQRPTFDWRDMAPIEHAHTFTVAKTAGYDVLDDIRVAVGEAIRDRQKLETFRANLQPILQAKGWWGKDVATDPRDGSPQIVQLGTPRRLQTIYWANVATARAAGEWERTQRTKAALPLLRYGRSTAENRRLQHAGWEGIILPVDHEWWDTHYPPNGWGCQCPVRQLTRGQAEREGYSEDDEPPPTRTRRWLNKRTGKWQDVPEGIDPGWAQNPGKTRQSNARAFLAERLDGLNDDARHAAVADLVGSPVMGAVWDNRPGFDPTRPRDPRRAIAAPLASLPRAVADRFGAGHGLVSLSVADAEKIRRKHRHVTRDDLRGVQTLLETGVIETDGGKLLARGLHQGKRWIAVIKITRLRELFLNSFHRID